MLLRFENGDAFEVTITKTSTAGENTDCAVMPRRPTATGKSIHRRS
jgi:hypothetical protein